MVGHMPLEHGIGVRVPARQHIENCPSLRLSNFLFMIAIQGLEREEGWGNNIERFELVMLTS
jgi:hypothetical protein